jgi:methylthioribose-1-phosphate isomerase
VTLSRIEPAAADATSPPAVVRTVRRSERGDAVVIVDQRRLPVEYVELSLRTVDEIVEAIRALAVRGAPAIGVAGALGLAASLAPFAAEDADAFRARAAAAAARIAGARPTAVNLPWAMSRMRRALAAEPAAADARTLLAVLRREADAILEEDRAMCRRIGEHGLPLLPDGARVLTHCNAGALATAGIGTALAPVYLAAEAGRHVHVWADETRPLLQGSRLTAWELSRAGIPVTVLADNMAASLMRAGRVDLCIVGADRIATNGDVANKIGTYALALAARHHGIPFYVAAPTSTFDPATPTGDAIEIECRDPDEVRRGFGRQTAPDDAAIHNPAFDVTPAELVTAIVSDRGIHRPPYDFAR